MTNPAPRLFTIPASVPFLPTLARALIEGRLVPSIGPLRDPLALAGATLYLPTRRACRLARDVFRDVIGGDGALLPRIVAIGDIDEDEIVFAEAATGTAAEAALELPEPLGALERKALLATLILKWAASPRMRGSTGVPLVAGSPAAAMRLAGDLAHLMDDMVTRRVPWEALDKLVPDDVDEYWQHTLDFLKIAREQWPAILKERGAIDPAARRDLLIEAERSRLSQLDGPVIAAGSTGSIPATAALIQSIAGLPHGAVVLPGLDCDLDAHAWDLIGNDETSEPGHPQYAMQALLRRLGVDREAVATLAPPAPHGRDRLVSEALRPAPATDLWQERLKAPEFAAHADAAVASLAVIEAANAEEEALAIAVALREAVETPGKTAALVTPDRRLARRVYAALERWRVPVDDSGGDSLADVPAGVFARLAADAALGGLQPVTLLALLKHPCGNFEPRAVASLERAVLRGPRPRAGTAGLIHALRTFRERRSDLHPRDPRSAIEARDLDAAETLAARLAEALHPLESLEWKLFTFSELARQHRKVLEALGGMTADLVEAFDDIAGLDGLQATPPEYPELFVAAIADRIVRRPEANVRVRIYGLLEARLQSVDRLVLGGLVESVWPPETRSDPWLSRPMRQTLGLDLPERRIGLTAHDFAQAMGAREVVLSRAAKLAGAPTVPSRFLQRLAAVAGTDRWREAVARGERYLTLARRLDAPAKVQRITRPAPAPPIETRPFQLSVTEIEDWLRDPYTIYARHILRLERLDPVDAPIGAADRGIAIHEAIGEFTKRFATAMPDDALAELERIGRRHFSDLDAYPEARALWWPRYLRIARWFASTFEPQRRENIAELLAEQRGEIEIPIGAQSFKLTTRADRIERLTDGRYAILDYKTGKVPTEKQVRTGLSPQLTLEAAILRRGGFPTIPAEAAVAALSYVALKGGEPPGQEQRIEFKEGDANAHADRALERLRALVERFADPATAYVSLVHPMWARRYGDYDHLARVKEWSLTGSEGDGDGE